MSVSVSVVFVGVGMSCAVIRLFDSICDGFGSSSCDTWLGKDD